MTAAHQLQWLLDKSEHLGFSVREDLDREPTVQVSARQTRQFRRKDPQAAAEHHRVTLVVAQYDGVLTVTDADRLRTALCDGIGPAKAYGCGLLTLAPLADPAPVR